MKSFILYGLIATLPLLASPSFAQDYPYEDAPTDNTDNKDTLKIPVEKPGTTSSTDGANAKKKYHALFRVGIKGGANYTIFQNPSNSNPTLTDQFSGVGAEGMIAFGWDMPYQPLFIEFETGYRGILLSSGSDPLNVIPLTLGVHYRDRLGRTSLWKPGLKSSLEIRYAKNATTGVTQFSMNPTITLSSLIEFGNLLFEPMMTVARIQTQYTFLVFAFRTGYRF